jgi:hypothetical protein
VLTNMLARGNFSNLYSYGRPSEQQLAQGDDAQYEEGQQQQQQQQQEQQQGGNAADGSKAAAAAASSSYPADTHYVDITEAIQQPDAEFALTHSDFLFTRAPLSGTLHINMPKKLVWDWQVPPAVASPAPAAAGAGAGAAGAAGGNNSTAAAVAGGAAATPVPAGPMGPAPAAGAQEAGAAGSEPKERMVTVYTPVPGTQKQQQ